MTKIWLLSDLHQEFARDPLYKGREGAVFDPDKEAPDEFDVVVLAGDIDVPLTKSLEWAASRFPGMNVIYVPGNHDFYKEEQEDHYTMIDQMNQGRDLAEKLGIHLLMNSSVELDGIKFIGGTLWTDFMVGGGGISEKMHEAAGRFGMNDYRLIKRPSSKVAGRVKKLRPMDTIAEHWATREYIEKELERDFDGSKVVVTHHAPHQNSLNEGRLAYCYASNLTNLMMEDYSPEMWMHGHTHKAVDYRVGKTNVVSNPRGYAFVNEDKRNGFNVKKTFELPSPNLSPKF